MTNARFTVTVALRVLDFGTKSHHFVHDYRKYWYEHVYLSHFSSSLLAY